MDMKLFLEAVIALLKGAVQKNIKTQNAFFEFLALLCGDPVHLYSLTIPKVINCPGPFVSK